MPLVVPALRFFVVFLNVYETFKTLKPPPPSARRGGQPSPRAISQRKRDLKGCLAVWAVWCCYAVHERTFDRIVGIFLPFYSEIKSVFLLFLLLTRAKGAEPLFLHVLRPLVKPYAVVLDPMLELSRDIGDFFFALLQVPLDYILSSPWFPSWCTGKGDKGLGDESPSGRASPSDSGSSTCMKNHSSIPTFTVRSGAVQTSHVVNGTRSVSDSRRSNRRPSVDNFARMRAFHDRHSSTASLPAYTEHPSHDPPRYSQTLSRHNGHQIWYPPSAYPASGFEGPVPALDPVGITPEYHSPEWRTYPAFPSAYPSTPLPPSAFLPDTIITRSSSNHCLVSNSAYPPLPEDEQGFDETLERVHEGRPGPVHGSSNTNELPPGVNRYEESYDSARQPDDDTLIDDSMCNSEAGLSEDDIGASLRTPHRLLKSVPSSGYSSVDSLTSPLTAANNTFPFQTKMSSDSESSGSSSLAGRKRTHAAHQGRVHNTLPASHSGYATLRGKPVHLPVLRDPPQSSTSEGENEGEDDEGGTEPKRQRVLDPLKRKSTVRPATRASADARKSASLSRNTIPSNRIVTTVRSRSGDATAINPVVKRKPTATTRQVMRGTQAVSKSSSTSSLSATLRKRAF